MARRSIWDDEVRDLDTEITDQADWDRQVNTDESAPDVPANRPATILDQLRTAEPKIQVVRDRSWERENPKKSYRKVPFEIRDTVKNIAESYRYNASHVAQAFLEYALMCYHRGDFRLELELSQSGLTLMPEGWSTEKKPIWAENAWGKPSTQKKRRRRKSGTPLWKQAVYYRLSPDLIAQIDEVCEAQRNPDGTLISRTYHDGEVVTRFLTFSIEAYNTGKLALRDPEDE